MTGKIAIVGKAASGKDFLKKKLISRGIRFGVSSTTRPPREGEVHRVDYNFMNGDQFIRHIAFGTMLLHQEFNGHYYGITQPEFDSCDAMILNVDVLKTMPSEMREKLFVIYLDIDDSIRIERMQARGFSTEDIIRRVKADQEQYEGFENYDLRITNDKF